MRDGVKEIGALDVLVARIPIGVDAAGLNGEGDRTGFDVFGIELNLRVEFPKLTLSDRKAQVLDREIHVPVGFVQRPRSGENGRGGKRQGDGE